MSSSQLWLAALMAISSSTSLVGQSPKTVSAPGFTLEDARGRKVSLADFRGRPVLVDFWATWCGPCRRSLPHVEDLHRKYSREGLQVLAINLEGREPNVLDYIRTGGYTFVVLFDPAGQVAQRYRVSGIPKTFLIDREGNLAYVGHPFGLREDLIAELLQ